MIYLLASITSGDICNYIYYYSFGIECFRLSLLILTLINIYEFFQKIIKYLKAKKNKKSKNLNKKKKKLTLKLFIKNFKIIYKYTDKKVFLPIIVALLFYESITLCEPKDNEKINNFIKGSNSFLEEVTVEEVTIEEDKIKLIKEKEKIRDDLNFNIFTTAILFIGTIGMLYFYKHFGSDWVLNYINDLFKDFNSDINNEEVFEEKPGIRNRAQKNTNFIDVNYIYPDDVKKEPYINPKPKGFLEKIKNTLYNILFKSSDSDDCQGPRTDL